MRFTIFGDEIRLVGFTIENGVKLLLTLALIGLVLLVRAALAALARPALRDPPRERVRFWVRQALNLAAAILIVLGILSIWFDDPTRLATALGLVTAGLAFALQRVVTALAGYFVILRGQTFGVGDRITMGGVRGDVIALGFIQTTIMEMGQPPAVQGADPAQWVRSRQYTGRVVTVSNARVFDEPVYNYTRDFPYLWEEISLPLKYDDNRERAEQILLECARRHTVRTGEMGEGALAAMRERYFVHPAAFEPKVYYRLTDNWLELTVRFVVEDRGIRDVKDAMSRDILDAFDAAGIGIASATYEIVGLPPLRVVGGRGRSRGMGRGDEACGRMSGGVTRSAPNGSWASCLRRSASSCPAWRCSSPPPPVRALAISALDATLQPSLTTRYETCPPGSARHQRFPGEDLIDDTLPP